MPWMRATLRCARSFVVSLSSLGAVHQAAGVDRVVRRIQDAAAIQLRAELFGFELVVRAAGDDLDNATAATCPR